MPFSQSGQISSIVAYCETLQPQSVLDVGVGMGQYGFLLRMNLENVHLFVVDGAAAWQRDKADWRVRIDGIEGCATYLTPVHDYVYNRMIIGEALAELRRLPDGAFDLVLAVDILEHFERDDGWLFLTECRRVCRRACLVSTPKDFMHQEIEANPLENHRSHWSQHDLQQAAFDRFLPDSFSWLAVSEKTLTSEAS